LFLESSRCMQISRSIGSMVNPLWLLLVVLSVSSLRRKRDNATAALAQITRHLADEVEEPDEGTKVARFQGNADGCQHYTAFKDQLMKLPCRILKFLTKLIKDDLRRQGRQAAFDVMTLGVLSLVSGLAEAGSLLSQATSPELSIPTTMTLGQLLEGQAQAGYSAAQKELMRECCVCHGDRTVQQCMDTPCYQDTVAVYKKVTEQHPAVAMAVNASGKIALTAVLAGIVVDAGTLGATGGAASAAAAQTAMYASISKNTLQVGHVAYSCMQRRWLKECWKAMCVDEGTG